MSLAERAIDEADGIISSIFGLARDAVRARRQEAEWFYVYRSRRAEYARTKVARRYWLWLARRSRAMMAANDATCCRLDDAMAAIPKKGGAA